MPAQMKKLDVDLEHVWQWLSYSAFAQAPVQVREAFQRGVEFGETLVKPAACYDVVSIDTITSSSLKLKGMSLENIELDACCQGAEELAIFIVTIGDHEVKYGRIR